MGTDGRAYRGGQPEEPKIRQKIRNFAGASVEETTHAAVTTLTHIPLGQPYPRRPTTRLRRR